MIGSLKFNTETLWFGLEIAFYFNYIFFKCIA